MTSLAAFGGEPGVPERGVMSRMPAHNWENAFVTGNGTLGAMVFGEPAHETIIGNDSRLFLPLQPSKGGKAGSARRFLPDIGVLLPKVREIIKKEGSPAGYITAQNLVCDEARKQGYMGYQFPGNYHAGCKLLLDMPVDGAAKDYRRSTNFENGEISVRWADEQGVCTRRVFSSRPDGVVVFSIRRDKDAVDASFRLGTFADMHYAKMTNSATPDGWLVSRVSYDYGKEEGKGGYVALIHIVPRGGAMTVANDTLSIHNSKEILGFLRIVPFGFGVTPPIKEWQKALADLPADYDGLLAKHAAVHGPLFHRAALDLGGGADRVRPVEELLAEGRQGGKYPPALFEKLYDVCRYVVISSSGIYPPGGKGIWIGQWQDRWNTVYTLDTNLQLETASILSANLPELMRPLADFFMNERVMADFRTNAKNIFGARGIQIPQTRWPDCGLNVAWGPNVSSGEYWTAGGAWFSSIFYDYYLYTGDKAFLKDRLVPFMKEVALFYEDFLVMDDTGRFRFSPGWSPENGVLAGAGDNPTMDIAACKELLAHLVSACETLGVEKDNIPKWKTMIGKLPPYVINADGALAEWALPGATDHYAHRHLSHLYPLWRSHEITAACPALWNAARVAVEKRIGAGGEDGSTHGLAFLALAGDALGDGNLAYAQLRRMLVNGYYNDSLLTAHFPNRKVLWIDGTGAWAEIVNGMLVSSGNGILDLLPALPDDLPTGTIRNILARGQIRVDYMTWDRPSGKIGIGLTSSIGQSISIRVPKARHITASGARAETSRLGDNAIDVALPADKPVALRLSFSIQP